MPPDAPPPETPPQPTITMVGRDGATVEVPHDQAAQAYTSGNYGFVKGSRVPVVGAGGTIGTVDAEHAGAVLSRGGRLAAPEELRGAELEAKYGDLGGHLAAAGEGAARGLTLGLSDPLAVGAGRLLGGEKGAEAVRRHLEEEQEAHPYLSAGAELAGSAAPILLSGGAAAPEAAAAASAGARALGAANEAETLAKIGAGVRKLGVLPEAVTKLGGAAEHALGGILGASDTALGSAARAAAKGAVRGITEGGLFGAGQEISDATLQDHDLTAEKLLTAVGHGALMGGLLGGGLAGTGKLAAEGAGRILGASSETLDDAAGHQAWKWLDPAKSASKEAELRAGGANAVGRTVFDEVLRPLVEEKGLTAAALNPEEKLDLVQQAIDRKGKAIGALVEGHSGASVKLSEMLRPIQERIDEYAGKVGGEDKVATLAKLRDSVTRVLGGEDPAAQIDEKLTGLMPGSPEYEAALKEAGYVKRTPAELQAHLRENPDLMAGRGSLPLEATHIAPAATQAGEQAVPIAKAIEQRRALQQIAFQEAKSLDPKLRVQLLRDVAGEWNRAEEEALNRASKIVGDGTAGTQLRELNKDFQRLKIAEKALENNTARYQTNNTFSLGDKMFAASTLAGGLASAHPATAIAAPLMGLGHKMLRAHGNAYAALILDRLSAWGGASKAVAEFDGAVDRAIDTALASKRPRTGGARRALAAAGDSKTRFEEEESRVRQLAAMSPGLVAGHLQQRTAPLETHMPKVAAAMQKNATAATAFLTSKLPPEPTTASPSLTPQIEKREPSAADRAKLLHAVDAVEGGAPEIMKRLAAGRMTPEDVEYLEKVNPRALDEIRQKVMAKCADRTKPVPYQAKLRLGTLLKAPTDATLQPAFIAGVQQSYIKHPDAPSSHGDAPPGPRKSAPAELSIGKTLASQFESARGGA